MFRLEQAAAYRAAKEAKQIERELWLPLLEIWLAYESAGIVRSNLVVEIARLRRLLGGQTAHEKRARHEIVCGAIVRSSAARYHPARRAAY